MTALSEAASGLLGRTRETAGLLIADGEGEACRELGMAGLCWWQELEAGGPWPEGLRGHTVIRLYPEARL